MSADINTEITLRGKKKELLAFIKVLRVFERDKLTQYQAGEECSYIEFVELDNGMDTVDLDDLTIAEIKELISECEENEIKATMEGPYGRFGKLGETDPFFKKLDECCKAHKGLWNPEAERLIFEHFHVTMDELEQ